MEKRVDEMFDRKPGAEVFAPSLFEPIPPREEASAPFDPMAVPRAELLTLLSEETVGELEPETARELGYELQRLATAIFRGAVATRKGKEAEARWRELCKKDAPDTDPGLVRELGYKLLKYSHAMRRCR